MIAQRHADLLRELVSNLIDNAIRYTPVNGHIAARDSDPASPTLEVEDDGIGIPEAERELVFERFYRVVGGLEAGFRHRLGHRAGDCCAAWRVRFCDQTDEWRQ